MANTFHIYFFGLICHVGDDDSRKTYAAMVRDHPHHEPKVFFESNPQVGVPIDTAYNHVGFELDGVFSPDGEAETSPEFLRYVPSLKRIMRGKIRPRIKDAAIIIHYPVTDNGPDRLTVPKLYKPKQGQHFFSGESRWGPECVAKVTGLTITTKASLLQVVSFRNNDRKTIGNPLGPNSCVIVANFSENSHPGHVRGYGKLLADGDYEIDVDKSTECENDIDQARCPWVRKWLEIGFAPDDLECGNTNWP